MNRESEVMFWKKKKPFKYFACKCGCEQFSEVVQIDASDFTPVGRLPRCIECGTIYGPKGEVAKEGK